MKTPEQLKGTIRSMAVKRNLRAQEVLQIIVGPRQIATAYKEMLQQALDGE